MQKTRVYEILRLSCVNRARPKASMKQKRTEHGPIATVCEPKHFFWVNLNIIVMLMKLFQGLVHMYVNVRQDSHAKYTVWCRLHFLYVLRFRLQNYYKIAFR